MEAIRTALLEDEPEYMGYMKNLLEACMRDLGEESLKQRSRGYPGN